MILKEMSITEFINFISQDSNHFIGFLVACGAISAIFATIFNGIVAIIKASRGKKTETVEAE